jgi:hypothetical protein
MAGVDSRSTPPLSGAALRKVRAPKGSRLGHNEPSAIRPPAVRANTRALWRFPESQIGRAAYTGFRCFVVAWFLYVSAGSIPQRRRPRLVQRRRTSVVRELRRAVGSKRSRRPSVVLPTLQRCHDRRRPATRRRPHNGLSLSLMQSSAFSGPERNVEPQLGGQPRARRFPGLGGPRVGRE